MTHLGFPRTLRAKAMAIGPSSYLAVAVLLQSALLLLCTSSVSAVEKVDAGAVLNSTGRIRAAPSIAAAAAIIVGVAMCLFGYKLLHPAIFICGFMAGGLLAALIIEYAFASMSWVATASWICFLVAGGISGFLALTIYNAGLFVIGALAGALLAFMLNTSFAHRIYPSQPDVMLVVLIIVLGFVGGMLAWRLEKPVIILATSFIGANALVWGIGYFGGKYPSGADLKRFRSRDSQGDWSYDIPDAWWAYLAITLLLFLVGVYWQFRRSGRGVHHQRGRAAPRRNDAVYESAVTPRHVGNPIANV